MKIKPLLLWLLVPIAAMAIYPLVKADPGALKIVSTALFIYVLFFSVVIHEVCHGLAAKIAGDPTAEQAGRLSLNPLIHVSVLGTIIVPLSLYLINPAATFGWAKPVPFNPLNMKENPRDQVLVAFAGPLPTSSSPIFSSTSSSWPPCSSISSSLALPCPYFPSTLLPSCWRKCRWHGSGLFSLTF